MAIRTNPVPAVTGTLVPRQRGETRPRPPALRGAGLATVLLGAALSIIDFFVVNVALPTIERDLHTSPAMLELVVAGYGIAYALLLVLGGRLGDAIGRRRMFTVGLAAFTLTSLACGLSPTVGVLVAARVAQGAAAAMMVPQVLSSIQAGTTGERRSHALGLYGAIGGIATVVGQLLGGVLVSADIAGTGWRPVFLINVPVGIVGLVLCRRTVPETRSWHPVRTDRIGTLLLGVTLLALLIPLTEGRAVGWPLWTWLSLAVVPVAGAGFVLVERRLERAGRIPLLPPSLLRTLSMRLGLVLAVPFFAGFGGFMFVYAVTLQDGLHLGPLGSGLALTPMAVGFFATSLYSSRLVTRFGARVVTAGMALQGLGIVGMVLATVLYWPHLEAVALAPGMLVTGIGMGPTMTTLFRLVLLRVPAERAGVGSGVLTTTQQTSLALGVAVLGSLFLSVGRPGSLGMRDAFVLVMVVQILAAAGMAVLSRRLPDPRA